MGELGAGIEVLKSLVFERPDDVGDGVVRRLLVEEATQDVFCYLIVVLVAGLEHFLHGEQDLGEAAHDGRQFLPVLLVVRLVEGPAKVMNIS